MDRRLVRIWIMCVVDSWCGCAWARRRRDIPMDDNEFRRLVQEEMDQTGLDEVTAAKVVSGRLAAPESDRDPANWRITSSLSRAMTAPPTANEPTVIPPKAPNCEDCGGVGYIKLLV